MIEPPPKMPTLRDAAEWIVRALKDEGVPLLLCGRGALLLQGEVTGTVDMDVLVGLDFAGALSVLGAYVDRGDLFPSGSLPGEIAQYLVSGQKPVDVIDVGPVHANLFHLLQTESSKRIELGAVGPVDVVTREGYFVLAIMIGLRGFASSRKSDPMMKVREAWAMFGDRTDAGEVNRLLKELGVRESLETALQPPASRGRGKELSRPSMSRGPRRGH